jgi:hypothetical protein
MNKKTLTLGFTALILAASIIYFFFLKNPKSPDFVLQGPIQSSQSEKEDQKALATLTEDQQDPSVSAEVQKAVTPEFLLWFRTEIVKTESQNLNPDRLEIELKEKALALSAFEIQFLTEKVLSETAEAREKILSIYILSLAGENSETALLKIASAPLQYTEAQTPHSPEEALSMQEKSLRRLAVESLLESARQNPALKEALLAEFQNIPDPELRQFALARLGEIK